MSSAGMVSFNLNRQKLACLFFNIEFFRGSMLRKITLLLFLLFSSTNAYGYIDPGSGSLILY